MGVGRVTWDQVGVWVVVVMGLVRTVGAQPKAAAPAADDPDFPPLKIVEFDVVDRQTNKPIEGVTLTGFVSNQKRTWVTGAGGHVKLDVDGGAKTLSIAATKDGYVPTTVTWVAAPRGEGVPGEYLMTLERGTTIGGVVTDEAGRPVAGADVALSLERKGDRPLGGAIVAGERASLGLVHVKTDPEGRWHFDEAPARLERVSVRLTHPDFVSDDPLSRREAPPEAKLRDRSAVMVMTQGVAVAGRVIDPNGKPVAGAQVALGLTRYGRGVPTAKSGADGRFVLTNCRPGRQATLIVKARGWAPYATQFWLNGAESDREVKLEAGRVMRIRVVDSKGEPIAGAAVSANRWRDMDALDWRGATNAEGRVVWNEAPADGVGLTASADGYVQKMDWSVRAGDREHVITLPAVLKVSGTVLDDATGKPIDKFQAIRGWTDKGREAPFWMRDRDPVPVNYGPDGTFDYTEDFGRDGYAVRVEAAGYVPAESRVIKPGEENVRLEFRLKRGKDLAATLQSVDGKPLAGADVLVVTESSQIMVSNGKPTSQTFTLMTKANGKGQFRIDPQAGKYSVLVLHDMGYANLRAEDLAGEGPVVTVQPWATIRGTALENRKPAAGRTITAMATSRAYEPRIDCKAVANERGEFVLDRVPPGPGMVGIEVRSQTGPTMWRTSWTERTKVEAEAGQTLEINLGATGRTLVGQLSAPKEIGGEVKWYLADVWLKSGAPSKRQLPPDYAQLAPAARQKLDDAWRASPEGQAESKLGRRYYAGAVEARDGSFRVADVEPGKYVLHARVMRPPERGAVAPVLRVWASAEVEVTVPEMPEGRYVEPLIVGDVDLKMSAAPAEGARPPAP